MNGFGMVTSQIVTPMSNMVPGDSGPVDQIGL